MIKMMSPILLTMQTNLQNAELIRVREGIFSASLLSSISCRSAWIPGLLKGVFFWTIGIESANISFFYVKLWNTFHASFPIQLSLC